MSEQAEESQAKVVQLVQKKRHTRLKTLSEVYASAETDELKWLWDGYLPVDSLVVFASYMKVGKSTLLYDLIGSIVQGKPFLGRATRQTPVIVLAVEEHERDVSNHCKEAGIPSGAPIYIHSGFHDCSGNALEELAQEIVTRDAKLLVIDTLSTFWQIKDENDNAEQIIKLAPLLALSRRLKITILMLHHTGKGQPGVDFAYGKEIRGASALFGIVDQALLYTRAKGGDGSQRVLRGIGRYSETPFELLIDFDPDTRFSIVDETVKGVERLADTKKRLLEHALAHPGLTRNALQEGAKVGRNTGLRLIGQLLKQNFLSETEGRLYHSSGTD